MCTVASAPAAFRVRVWHLMSRGRGPRGGDRCRRSFVLPILNSPADHALRTDALDPRPTPLSPLAPRRAPRLDGARSKEKIRPGMIESSRTEVPRRRTRA